MLNDNFKAEMVEKLGLSPIFPPIFKTKIQGNINPYLN